MGITRTPCAGGRRAAEAVARPDALLAVDHRGGQSLGRQQQEALVGLVGPAQRDAVGARDPPHMPRKSGRQLVQRRGLGDQRRHVVQRLEPLALFLQLGRLFGDLALQVPVHRLQVLRHAVEALGQRAELVAGDPLHPGAEIAALDAFGRFLQLPDGFQHEQVPGIQQHRGADDGQRHHRDLQQVQQRSPARHVRLDRRDERIDVRGEVGNIGAQRVHRIGLRGNPPRAELRPVALDHREVPPHGIVPRHEQRTLGIAVAQKLEAALELRPLGRQRLLVGRADRQRQPIRLHPHAAGLVDRRRAALELPRYPQRDRDHQQRQQQERRAYQRKLGAQAPVSGMSHGGNLPRKPALCLRRIKARARLCPKRRVRG